MSSCRYCTSTCHASRYRVRVAPPTRNALEAEAEGLSLSCTLTCHVHCCAINVTRAFHASALPIIPACGNTIGHSKIERTMLSNDRPCRSRRTSSRCPMEPSTIPLRVSCCDSPSPSHQTSSTSTANCIFECSTLQGRYRLPTLCASRRWASFRRLLFA